MPITHHPSHTPPPSPTSPPTNATVGSKIVATFTDHSTGKEINLYLRGDFWGGSADISIEDGGPVVAQIERDLFKAREFFGDKQTVSIIFSVNEDYGCSLRLAWERVGRGA